MTVGDDVVKVVECVTTAVDTPDNTSPFIGDGYWRLVRYRGSWSGGKLIIGGNYLWIDSSGRLRIKGTVPTSDTDGIVVGSQS